MAKIIVKKPGEDPCVMDFPGKFRGELGSLIGEQVTVEYLTLGADESAGSAICMLMDEDGKLKKLPANFYIPLGDPLGSSGTDLLVGTIVFARYALVDLEEEAYDYELVDVTEKDVLALHSFLSKRVQQRIEKVFL